MGYALWTAGVALLWVWGVRGERIERVKVVVGQRWENRPRINVIIGEVADWEKEEWL